MRHPCERYTGFLKASHPGMPVHEDLERVTLSPGPFVDLLRPREREA